MLLPEELKRKWGNLDPVAVFHDREIEVGCRCRDPGRTKELDVGAGLEDALQMFGSPVVGVLVRHDDGDDAVRVRKRNGE